MEILEFVQNLCIDIHKKKFTTELHKLFSWMPIKNKFRKVIWYMKSAKMKVTANIFFVSSFQNICLSNLF